MSRTTTAILCALLAAPAIAGSVFDIERRNEDGQIDSTITAYVQDGKLRVDQIDEEEQRTSLIYDGERLIDIDLSGGSYAIVERKRIEAARRTEHPDRTLRDELLAEVPAARRGDSMSMLSRPPLSIGPVRGVQKNVPTARYARYAGMRCRVHQVLFNAQLHYEYCMVYPAPPALESFMTASDDATALLHDFYATLGAPWLNDAMQRYWTHVFDLPGAPLWLREYEDGAVISEFAIVAVRTETIDATRFAVPHGLRKRAVLDFSAPRNAPGAQSDEEGSH